MKYILTGRDYYHQEQFFVYRFEASTQEETIKEVREYLVRLVGSEDGEYDYEDAEEAFGYIRDLRLNELGESLPFDLKDPELYKLYDAEIDKIKKERAETRRLYELAEIERLKARLEYLNNASKK